MGLIFIKLSKFEKQNTRRESFPASSFVQKIRDSALIHHERGSISPAAWLAFSLIRHNPAQPPQEAIDSEPSLEHVPLNQETTSHLKIHGFELARRPKAYGGPAVASFLLAKGETPVKTQEVPMIGQVVLATLLSLSAVALTAGPGYAHGGGLDSHGCHHDRKNGGYHCHQGPLAGQSFASKREMLAALEARNKPPKDLPEQV